MERKKNIFNSGVRTLIARKYVEHYKSFSRVVSVFKSKTAASPDSCCLSRPLESYVTTIMHIFGLICSEFTLAS